MFLRKQVLFGLLVLLLFFSGNVFSQVNKVMQSWVSKFNGIDSLSDRAFAIDVRGCIYITGSSVNNGNTDYTTLKYNPDGELIWSRTFIGGGTGLGIARAIVVDNACNAYVTGTSVGNFTTIKYDSLGNEIWVAVYNGSANTNEDIAKAIGLDDNGNVYIAGYSVETGSAIDFTVIKYDNSGTQQWINHFNGAGNGFDIATGFAVEGNGNVIVNGRSQKANTDYDIVTIKYNAGGTQVWQRTISDSLNFGILGTAFARALRTDPVAVDNQGGVYILSTAGKVVNDFDFLTTKYLPDGTLKWMSRFNGPGNSNDRPFGIAVDNTGEVYVTGASVGILSGPDFVTIKYDKNGVVKWIQRYDGPASAGDASVAIVLDDQSNVYITGSSDSGASSFDYATIKYRSTGDMDWVIRYDGETGGADIPAGIALDAGENIYVTGSSQGTSTDLDITTIKYNQDLPPKITKVTDDMRTIAIGLLGVSGNPVIKNLIYQNLTLGIVDIESDTLKYFFISIPNLIQQAAMLGIDLKDSMNRIINLVNNTNPNKDNVTKILNGIAFNGNKLSPHIFIPFFDSFDSTELAQNPLLGYGFMEQDYPLNGFSGLSGNSPTEKLLIKNDVTGNPAWFVFPIIPAACFINGNICPIILTECFVANFACAACNSTFPVGGIPAPANFPQLCGNLQNHEFKLILNTDNCINALLWDATLPVANYALLSSLQGYDFWTLAGSNPTYARKTSLPIRKYHYQGIQDNHKLGTMLTLCDNCNEFHSYPSQDNFGVTGALALGGVYKLSRIGQKSLYFVLPFTQGLWYNGSLDALIYYGTIPLSGTCFAGIQKIREDYLYSTSNQYLSNSLGFNNTDFLASTDLNAISGFWLDNVISVGFTQSFGQFANPLNVVVFNAPFSSAPATGTLLQELKLDGNGYMINRDFPSFIAPNTILKVQVDATFKNGEIISGFQTITIQGTQQIGTVVADIRGQIENFNANILNYRIRIFQ